MLPIEPMIVGMLGAFCTEALKIYELYHAIDASKFRRFVKSRLYMGVSATMMVASGLVASAFAVRIGSDAFMAFMHGAAAGPTIRAICKAPASTLNLGAPAREEEQAPRVRDVL
jgi:hypothetical protein